MWREVVLPGSETFIRDQLDGLTRWSGVLAGIKEERSPLSRPSDAVVFGDSHLDKVRRAAFKRVGRSLRVDGLLRKVRPALVHAHFLPGGTMILPTVKRLHVPLVVSALGYDAARTSLTSTQNYRRSCAALFEYADRVLVPSSFLRQQVVDLGAPAEKVEVLHFGLPLEEKPLRCEEERDIIYDFLFVGRLVQVKGAEDLLLSAHMVAERLQRNIRVGIVGDGALRSELEALAGQLAVDAHWLGRLEPAGVRWAMDHSRVFVGPSKVDEHGAREAFGQVFLEAAAAGLPVAAYRSGGVPEAVEDGWTGLLSPEGDVEALAQAMERLLQDPMLRRQMGCRGAQRVRDHFDSRASVRRLECLYDEVASR